MSRTAAVILAVALSMTASAPPGEAQDELVVGVCEVDLVVTLSLDQYDFAMDEVEGNGVCTTTTDGTDTGEGALELSGSADGVPVLTCAGGFADGIASITFENPVHRQETDVGDLQIANKGGAVTFQAVALNAMTDVEVFGNLVQMPTAGEVCANQLTEVHWSGTMTVQGGNIP